MNKFLISANDYLSTKTKAFYHVPYTKMHDPDNPNYLNYLKNTYSSYPQNKLQSAANELLTALELDLPKIHSFLGFNVVTICVVPRAKSENTYKPNQQLFRKTVQDFISLNRQFEDGTSYIIRHTNTYTTHLGERAPNYNNDGFKPFPGITEQTCDISSDVVGKDILLIDDIYTPGVNIDEDAINALLNAGAHTVSFYAVGRVQRD